MPQEPEQMLEQNGAASFIGKGLLRRGNEYIRKIKTRASVTIKQQEDKSGQQNRPEIGYRYRRQMRQRKIPAAGAYEEITQPENSAVAGTAQYREQCSGEIGPATGPAIYWPRPYGGIL